MKLIRDDDRAFEMFEYRGEDLYIAPVKVLNITKWHLYMVKRQKVIFLYQYDTLKEAQEDVRCLLDFYNEAYYLGEGCEEEGDYYET